ncbi:hypothetical protein [Streptomyces sp. NRRL S-340]|uniref:hypothetical protein n=1 Tax=Streptomyces sp. NRRL S-340 TaxID=1463901 RepID=UPI00131D65D6|nr:hypothetical protein [Streptomyces sp. NRRL S-340]
MPGAGEPAGPAASGAAAAGSEAVGGAAAEGAADGAADAVKAARTPNSGDDTAGAQEDSAAEGVEIPKQQSADEAAGHGAGEGARR